MSYIALDDLRKLVPEDALVQFTDDESLGTVDEARVDEAIESAQAEADGYLGIRYTVPLASPSEAVKAKVADIALYNLYSRTLQEMPEVRRDRYKAAVKWLEGVAKGTVSLGAAEEPSPATPDSGAETNVGSDTQTFTREKLEGF